ncbi:MAG: hypothetical protein LBJ43_03655 [Propionibacteriaceae bacterium]|jgi:hypothetical protein|nr:hypothetical protein [Propionibacteriaceae bacterium]
MITKIRDLRFLGVLRNQRILLGVSVATVLTSTITVVDVLKIGGMAVNGGLSVKVVYFVVAPVAVLLLVGMKRSVDQNIICELRNIVWFALIVVLAATPALLVGPSFRRLAPLLALIVHAAVFWVAYAIFDRLSHKNIRLLVGLVGWGLLALIAAETLVTLLSGGRISFSGDWTRPELLTEEYTWLALVLALVACAALTLRIWPLAVTLGVVVALLDTRSAMILYLVGAVWVLREIVVGKLLKVLAGNKFLANITSDKVLRIVPQLLSWGLALWFTITWMFKIGRNVDSTIGTRVRDIADVREANSSLLMLIGGDVDTVIYNPARWRTIPRTSNVQLFEMLWKFGLGGVVIIAAWCVFILWRTPYGSILRANTAPTPAQAALLALPAMAQFNNVTGMVWSWVLVALLLVVLVKTHESEKTTNELAKAVT